MSANLTEKLAHLPETSGVYLFKDASGELIYIGKARILKNRVRSYFQESRTLDQKTAVLRHRIADIEYIVTDSEVEALLLESHLVKKNRPRFNVHLKDDKSFPYIKLTIQEEFPRIFITRLVRKDGALYFGPFLPAGLARNTLKLVHKHFQLRTCNIPIDGRLPRPCLDYHIKRCMGPCVASLCQPEDYQQAVRDVRLFLEGKSEYLLAKLKNRMHAAAAQQQFEAAALLRDQTRMVEALSERQKMVMNSTEDADFFGFYQEGSCAALQVFTMRGSRMVGRREFFWEDLECFEPAEFLEGALRQYYVEGSFIPCSIFIPQEIEERALLEQVLSNRRGQKVTISAPKIGDRQRLLQLVGQNAKLAFDNRFRTLRAQSEVLLAEFQAVLRTDHLPRRVECFDISSLQGTDTVGSMVVCDNGQMKKAAYRKFRIRTVQGSDDFAAIKEVVYRRYKRTLEEDQSLPDLVLIDGGKGQLSAAHQALSELGLESLPLASIAKEEEILFVHGYPDQPVLLERSSPVLHLIQRIRDEAHRFAVGFHRKRRTARDFASALLDIPGIGKKTQARLLQAFGSLKRIREADFEALSRIVGPSLAEVIKKYLIQ